MAVAAECGKIVNLLVRAGYPAHKGFTHQRTLEYS